MRMRMPGGRIVHRGKSNVGAEIDVRELLQELRRTALLDRGGPVDDELLVQTGRVYLGPLERERHARVAPHVLELALLRVQVRGHEVVAVDRHPHEGDLRRAARSDRDQVAERARADQVLGAVGQGHAWRVYVPRTRCSARSRSRPARFRIRSARWSRRWPRPPAAKACTGPPADYPKRS